jgi:hypothetical protein
MWYAGKMGGLDVGGGELLMVLQRDQHENLLQNGLWMSTTIFPMTRGGMLGGRKGLNGSKQFVF